MLRIALANVARTPARSARVSRQVLRPVFVRYESSGKPDPEALKAAHKTNDALQRDWQSPLLTYEQVKPKTEHPSSDAYLIDVREPNEVIQGSIPSAVNLPLSVLATSLGLSSQDFRAQHGFDKPQKSQEIVFYCRSGKRSASACDIARRNGYDNLFNYQGSWLDWVAREARQKS